MQSSIQDDFQKAYSERVKSLQKFYEMRNETMLKALEGSYLRVLQSELLQTMIQDETTLTYAQDMID